ncbi:MAG: S-adenosylmethionine:tRNA ribosyltransferase-isomerase, partial [Candidatus Electrothrix sp. AR3]|nr:S-adenosylmethionine:tRNA ribosyltransferase-isomerase [Candidatus Electrothrix sp. AR3]
MHDRQPASNIKQSLNSMPENDFQSLYRLSSYNYPLPEELIAQQPASQRDESRLLVLDAVQGKTKHSQFNSITALFKPGDLLVVNNTKVFPARLLGKKETGGKVEMLLLHFPEAGKEQGQASVLTLIKSSKRPQLGSILLFAPDLQARVDSLLDNGKVEVTLLFPPAENLEEVLNQYGQIPLPPYIKRPKGSTALDFQRYQTKYARYIGSVAAPTAGLHFSQTLMKQIKKIGVKQVAVTLHVGYG